MDDKEKEKHAAIIQDKLNKNEKSWLNNYHKTVFKNLIKDI